MDQTIIVLGDLNSDRYRVAQRVIRKAGHHSKVLRVEPAVFFVKIENEINEDDLDYEPTVGEVLDELHENVENHLARFSQKGPIAAIVMSAKVYETYWISSNHTLLETLVDMGVKRYVVHKNNEVEPLDG